MHRPFTVSLLTLLTAVSSACGAQEKAAAGGNATNGWVTLPSGGRLYYDVVGTKGDTIVVPGAVYWESALKPLAQNHVVVFYDLLGRGRSDSASGSRIALDSIVADLETLRKSLKAERIGLVGISVNGLVTAAYAAAHPDRVSRLALVNAIAPTAEAQASYKPPERTTRVDSTAQRELMRLRETGGSREAICRQFWKASGGWFVGDPAAASRLNPTWCSVPNETVDASLLWLGYLSSASGSWDLTATARSIKAQALVVRAQRDYFANPEGGKAWAAAIPGARLLTLPGLGHLAVLEKPDAVNGPLQQFFAGKWPPGAAAP
ncbi:MAG TPA: alpha/beta hydrolase [Gemmatimonadales bacterium]|nr:alpha/beta hydrolase [Gemmatimonadales bacterium]